LVVKTGLQVIQEAGTEIPHLIAPLLPERSVVVMAGHSGTFKTWHALDLMLAGAFGLPWLDHPELVRREQPFATLYINKEMGGAVLATRLKSLARNERYKDHPDYEKIITEKVFSTDEAELDLNSPEQRARLEETLLSLKVELVVLDSLSMCWSGDEDNNSQVGVFYSQLRMISERTGVTWVIIHHLGKPTSTRPHIPAKFTVRGAGQIIQQADSAIILSPHNEGSGDPDVRQVSIEFVKTRTDREPETCISEFRTNDGFFASVNYGGKVAEEAAKEYASSGGDATKFAAWFTAQLAGMPAMHPTGSGLRTKNLLVLLQAAWPASEGSPPAPRTFQRRIEMMVESGELEILEENKKHGNLYRFRVVEEPPPVPLKPGEPT
jgi:hypothetical protein